MLQLLQSTSGIQKWDYDQGRIVDVRGNWYEAYVGRDMIEAWVLITREMAEGSKMPLSCIMIEILSYNI